MKARAIEVRDLTKVYEPSPLWMRFLLRSAIDEPVRALDGIGFTVEQGDICAVVGPNGAGKSTLFRVLTGLTTPTGGAASVLGLDCARESVQVRRMVGFVPADDRSLFLRHTCRENLIFHGHLQGLARSTLRQRVDDALELVGLSAAARRAGFALSSGMRARLQLARALLHEPRVLILDEPTGSLDPLAAFQVLQTLERVTAEHGLAVLISSHRLEEIEALHNDVLLLDRGRIVHKGDIDSLRRSWDRPRLEIRFATAVAAAQAAELLGAHDDVEVDADGSGLSVRTRRPVGALLGLLDGQLPQVVSVTETRITLRELLAKMAGAPAAHEGTRPC